MSHESADRFTSSDRTAAVARADLATVPSHETADSTLSTDRAGAVTGGDAAATGADETADAPLTRDRTGAVARGDATTAGTDETADTPISRDRAGTVARCDAAMEMEAHEAADILMSTDRAGAVAVGHDRVSAVPEFARAADEGANTATGSVDVDGFEAKVGDRCPSGQFPEKPHVVNAPDREMQDRVPISVKDSRERLKYRL
jgi:hypothetical protein